MIEAAYTAATGNKMAAHPTDVRPPFRDWLDLKRFVQESEARKALTPAEFADLAERQDIYREEGFEPECRWKGTPAPKVDYEGHPMAVSFTNPIFSTDGRLALLELSFDDQVGFGYGVLCIVRAQGRGWTARCHPSWIT